MSETWVWGLGVLLITGVIAVTVLLLCGVALVKFISRLAWLRILVRWRPSRRLFVSACAAIVAILAITWPYVSHFVAVQIVWNYGGVLQYEGGKSMVNVIATRETFRTRSGETLAKEFTGPVVGLRMLPDDWRLPRWVLGRFPDLEFLGLNQVEPADFARIGKLKKLKMLIVHPIANVDAGVESLASLPELWSLRINRSNSLTDAGAELLSQAPKLRALWLQSRQITDEGLRQLGKLPLTDLIVCSPRITDAGVAHLQTERLSWLSVEGTSVTNDGLLKLCAESEWLSTNPPVHAADSEQAEIVELLYPQWRFELDPAGRVVRANSNAYSFSEDAFSKKDAGALLKLPDLQHLTLVGETINDESLHQLAGLKKVQAMQLAETAVTPEGIASLSSWPALASMTFYGEKLSPEMISALAGLERLESLDLEEVPMSGEHTDALARSKSLKRLKLRFCGISDSDIDALSKMSNLERLDLSGNELSGAALAELSKLHHLQVLVVKSIDLSNEDVMQLEQALPDCKVFSEFSEEWPESWEE